MSGRRVAVVTGSNKGIGFAIVRGLCQKFDGDVFLTARNPELGHQAVADLNKEGLQPKFHQLDITDNASIDTISKFLANNYGGLDLLVNNAGMAYKQASTAPFAEQVEVTSRANFTGTLDVCNALFPLLRPHARVVNVASMSAPMAVRNMSAPRRAQVYAANTMEAVEGFMKEFISDTKAGNHKEKGWPESAYGMSKVGEVAMTIVQQADISKVNSNPDIVINCVCPGYVNTDMTSHKGHLTIDQGADSPIYLALLPNDVAEPRGKFVSQRKIQQWG